MTGGTEGCIATSSGALSPNVERRAEGPALSPPVSTHMGDADAAVDGEGRGQVLIELAEPGSVDLVHQLGHTDHLWGQERG